MPEPRQPHPKLKDYKYDSSTKEYASPKGKRIHLSANMCIVILTIWWLVIIGVSYVEP